MRWHNRYYTLSIELINFWQKFIVRILKRRINKKTSNEWVIMLAVMFIMESSVTTTTHRQCKSETDDEMASSSWAKSLLVVCPGAHHQILIHRFECNTRSMYGNYFGGEGIDPLQLRVQQMRLLQRCVKKTTT